MRLFTMDFQTESLHIHELQPNGKKRADHFAQLKTHMHVLSVIMCRRHPLIFHIFYKFFYTPNAF